MHQNQPTDLYFSKIVLVDLHSSSIDYRSSYQRCSVKKGVLTNFTKFTGKRLCQSLFFNKVTGLRPATLLKERLWHRSFPVNFVKFLRTPRGDCFWDYKLVKVLLCKVLQYTLVEKISSYCSIKTTFFLESILNIPSIFAILSTISKLQMNTENSRFFS